MQIDTSSSSDIVTIQSLASNTTTANLSSGQGNGTYNFTANGIPSGVTLSVQNTTTNGSDSDSFNIGAGGTLAIYDIGPTRTYQAFGLGKITMSSVKPSVGYQINGAGAGTIALGLNFGVTSSQPVTTVIRSDGSGNSDFLATGPASSSDQIATSLLSSIVVGGGVGGNSLTVDYSSGDPLPFGQVIDLPPVPTSSRTNLLTLTGSSGGATFTSETYASSGPNSGVISYNDATNPSGVAITYSTLSSATQSPTPVTDLVPSSGLTFNVPSRSPGALAYSAPAINGIPTARITDGGSSQFAGYTFANKTGVTLNVPAAGAYSDVSLATAPAGLSTFDLSLAGGGNNVILARLASGITATLATGAGSTIVVGNGSLAEIIGNVLVRSTGSSSTLTIDSSVTSSKQTYTIANDRVSATTSPSSIDFSGGGIGTLDVNSVGNGDTFNFTGPANAGVGTYNFSADSGTGPNTLNVTSSTSTFTHTAGGSPNSGTLGFGYGAPVVNYTNFQAINATRPSTAPTLTALTFSAAEGQAFSNVPVASFTSSDPGVQPGNFQATIDWGDNTTSTGTVVSGTSAGTFEVLGSHQYAAAGTFTVKTSLTYQGSSQSVVFNGTTITTTSSGSPTPTIASTSVTVAGAPLTAQDATINGQLGLPIPSVGSDVLVATFMDTGTPDTTTKSYTATIDWGDGTTSAATRIVAAGTPLGIVFSVYGNHTYANNTVGTYPVSVTIAKTTSGSTAIASGQAVITDAPLIAATPLNLSVTTGTPLSGAYGSFRDPNTSALPRDFTATIDWGDGSPSGQGTVTSSSPTVFVISGSNTYATPGVRTVSMVAHSVNGSFVTVAANVTVSDASPTGTANSVSAVEGTSTGTIVLATITDPNPLATTASLSATVNWGDGTATVPAAIVPTGGNGTDALFEVVGSHTYATADVYTVSIAVKTSGGVATTPSPMTATATVAAAPLSAAGSTITGIERNSTGPVVLGTFTSADPSATTATFTTDGGSVVVDWGDGSSETLPASSLKSSGSSDGVVFTVTGTHTYATPGTYQILLDVTGSDDATAHGQAAIADAPLSASASQPSVSTTEDRNFSGAVGSFTDGNPLATAAEYTYVMIDWGDGTPATAGTVAANSSGTGFLVDGIHEYADAGVNGGTGHYPITVNVHDVYGATLTITSTADVADVPMAVSGKLNPASDTGVSDSDNITSVNQPDFIGTVNQPGATIRLYATPTGGGAAVLIGTGSSDSGGTWSITANRSLADGAYAIAAVATDAAGRTVSPTTTFVSNLVVDTVGPKVTSVVFARFSGRIVVTLQDYGGPGNAGTGLVASSLIDASNYQLAKANHPQAGQYRVNLISDAPGTTTGTQTVTLAIDGGKYLRGGRYLFTILAATLQDPSGVRDVAGNALDGEFYGYFPSGNNVNGGNFVAGLSAVHHTIFAPTSTIGRATPVSPPGSRERGSYVHRTYNPSQFPAAGGKHVPIVRKPAHLDKYQKSLLYLNSLLGRR